MDIQQNLEVSKNKSSVAGTSSSMQNCIDNCTQCHQACVRAIAHCLEKGGAYADLKHIQILQDCTRISEVSSSFMIRHSGFHTLICDTCAKICKACAESCDSFDNDEVMQACAEACRKCAKSCEEMSLKH